MSSQTEIKPPAKNELLDAVVTVLGALPDGADIHFFWMEGMQHVCVGLKNREPVTYHLTRKLDGSGVISCNPHCQRQI